MTDPVVVAERVCKRFRVPLDSAHSLQYRFAHPVSTSKYRVLSALDEVSFAVPRGQFLGIAGPNGCGKSTLLKVLSGIYAADAGQLRVLGRVSPFLELGVGFKSELTARENIILGGSVLGLTRRQLTARADAVLDFAELAGFADQKLKNFSSGMVVRLAFSVATLADADILLMDEVLAVGDAHFRKKCFDVFAYYKRSGRTVILVSHDLGSLELYCDRLLLMDRGRILADGEPSGVAREYRELVAEREDVTQNQSQQPAVPPSRRGSLDVEITGVRVLDGELRPHSAFYTGGHFVVAIDYKVNRSAGPVVCALLIQRSDGHSVAAPNTKSSRFPLRADREGQTGTVYYRVPRLGLLSASYGVSVAIFDEHINRSLDRAVQAVTFQVTDSAGTPGEFDLGGQWEHSAPDEAATSLASSAPMDATDMLA